MLATAAHVGPSRVVVRRLADGCGSPSDATCGHQGRRDFRQRFLPGGWEEETPRGTVANSDLLSFDRPGWSGFSEGSWQRVSASDIAPEILWQPAQTCGPQSR